MAILVTTPMIAGAYALPAGSGQASNNGVTIPQLPAGTFSPDWTSFLNNLPFQGFITSLQSAGQSVMAGSSVSGVGLPTSAVSGATQGLLTGLDAWSAAHLGFRFSALLFAILGIFSWVLGIAKSAVDWLIGFLK
jgi:hypothetical protein